MAPQHHKAVLTSHGILMRLRTYVFVLLMNALAVPTLAIDSDPFPAITLPIHEKAINPTIKYNSPVNGAKAAVYTMKIQFPARDLTNFYDSQMKRMGFERFPDGGSATFGWMNFNNKSGQWEKTITVPARYTAAWTNRQRTLKIWLYIAYKYDAANKEWNSTPLVSVNIAKTSVFKATK